MQDLYRGFKKVSEDDQHAVLEHEQGHRLNIAKSGLSKKHLKSLSQLPLHQAEGTEKQKIPVEIEEQKEDKPRELPDLGQKLEQAGATVIDAVANKISEGALKTLSPQEIEKMPEPTATDVATGEPVYKGAYASPEEKYIQALGPQGSVVSPLDVMSSGFKPGQAQKSYDELRKDLEQQQATKQQVDLLNQQEKQRLLTEVGDETLAPDQAGLVKEPSLAAAPASLADQTTAEQPPPSQLPEPPAPTKAPTYATLMDLAADPNQPESVRIEALMQEQIRLVKEYNTQMDEWRKFMSTKPDNQRADLFANRSTWGKIGVALGLLMGGMSSGITGKPNPVLELINKEIEEETHRQKNATEGQMNLYKMNLQMLGDQRQAYLQTINQLRELSQLKADEVLGKSGVTPQTRTAAETFYAENKAKTAKANSERAQLNIASTMRAKQQAGVQGEIPDIDDPWIERAVRVKMPDGQVIKRYVKDKGLLKEAQEDFSQLRRVQEIITDINNFNRKYGMTTGIPIIGSKEENERAKLLNEVAQTEIAKLMSGRTGALRPGLLDKFPSIMPKAGAMVWNQAEQQARSIEANRMLDRLRKEMIDQYIVQ